MNRKRELRICWDTLQVFRKVKERYDGLLADMNFEKLQHIVFGFDPHLVFDCVYTDTYGKYVIVTFQAYKERWMYIEHDDIVIKL